MLFSAPAKPRPCTRPNRNATSAGKRRASVSRSMQRLARDQHDRQRDAGLDRRRPQRQPAERAARQRQAVRQREGGDRPDQPAREADQEQQADHEQQVVDAAQDVLDAEHRVGARDLAHAAPVVGGAVELHRRLRGGERVDAASARRASRSSRARRSSVLPTPSIGERALQAARAAMQRVRPRRCSPRARRGIRSSPMRALVVARRPLPQELAAARSRAPPSRPCSSRARVAGAARTATARRDRERASARRGRSSAPASRLLVLHRVLLRQRADGGAALLGERPRRSSPAARRRAAARSAPASAR